MPRSKKQNKQSSALKKKTIQTVSGSGAYGLGTLKNLGGKIKQMAKEALKSEAVKSGIVNGAGSLADKFVPGAGSGARHVARLLLNRISGSGDYEAGGDPSVNSLFKMNKNGQMTGGNALSIPKFESGSNGVHVSHREYVMDLVAPDNPEQFNLLNMVINPGDPTIFPWLSNMAVNFQQYKMLGLVIEYVSTTSSYNPTPAMGFVAIAAQYNVLQAPFASMIELENSSDSIFCRPDKSIMYGVECKRQSYNMYYVRTPSSTVIDPATYDFVQLYIGTQGLPTSFTPGTVMGQIWISYHLELIEPIYTLPYGGSFMMNSYAVSNAENGLNDFLAPLATQGEINYTGRFTPKSLDGSGMPILSFFEQSISIVTPYGTISPAGDGKTNLISFRPYNLVPGQGFKCTLTFSFSIPTYTSVTATTSNACFPTPAIALLNLVDCGIGSLDSYGIFDSMLDESMISARVLAPTTGTVSYNRTRTKGTYSVSWYMAVNGQFPAFDFACFTNVVDTSGAAIRNPVGYNPPGTFVTYGTNFTVVSIKYTDDEGTPVFVPYTPPVAIPALQSRKPLDGMMSTSSITKSAKKQTHDDHRLLRQLLREHGITISHNKIIHTAPEIEEDCSDADFCQVVSSCDVPPPPPRVRSLSFSSKF